MMKRVAAVLLVVAVAVLLTGRRSAAVDGDGRDGRIALPGLDQAAGEFWGRWEGSKPSDAIRRAAITQDDQRSWEDLGRLADDFQSRSGGGRCLGHSEIARKSMGDNLQYLSFLALYDPTPLRIHLLYYRSKDTWNLIGLRIDGDPQRWLAEAAQAVSPTPPTAVQNAGN
ncbi:MAG TPA: hypothetical protein VGI81_25435 [Tepidisphaeraceae bacterium]|jgi:hypothetical protein